VGVSVHSRETSAVIDYNGDVRACELREKFASLADFDFDFNALWSANERQSELNAIDGGKACWCTHVCFIHDSMRHSRRAMLYDVPRKLPDTRKLVTFVGKRKTRKRNRKDPRVCVRGRIALFRRCRFFLRGGLARGQVFGISRGAINRRHRSLAPQAGLYQFVPPELLKLIKIRGHSAA
jgi:hypothetical protein